MKACIPAKPLSSSLDAKGGLADGSVVGQCITRTWDGGSRKWAYGVGMGAKSEGSNQRLPSRELAWRAKLDGQKKGIKKLNLCVGIGQVSIIRGYAKRSRLQVVSVSRTSRLSITRRSPNQAPNPVISSHLPTPGTSSIFDKPALGRSRQQRHVHQSCHHGRQ